MDMDQDREKQALQEKLDRCRRLACEFNDGITAKNLREIAGEIEQQIRAFERT
jgi:hypothetical protein